LRKQSKPVSVYSDFFLLLAAPAYIVLSILFPSTVFLLNSSVNKFTFDIKQRLTANFVWTKCFREAKSPVHNKHLIRRNCFSVFKAVAIIKHRWLVFMTYSYLDFFEGIEKLLSNRPMQKGGVKLPTNNQHYIHHPCFCHKNLIKS
jgi:hypothetical protein